MRMIQELRRRIGSIGRSAFYCRRSNRITERCAAEEEGIVCPCAAECPIRPFRFARIAAMPVAPRMLDEIC